MHGSILCCVLFFASFSCGGAACLDSKTITVVDEFERLDSAKMASVGVEAVGGLIAEAEHVRLYPTGAGTDKGYWPTGSLYPWFCEADGSKWQCPPPSEGFKSDAEPYPTTYHARFSGSGTTCTAGSPQFYFDDPPSCFARWLRLKSIAQLGLSNVNSFSQLTKLQIVWIPGTNTNGGDRPDVHTFLPNGYVRARENLHLIAVDANENRLCNLTLWDIHDYNGTIAPPWTGSGTSPYLREYTPEEVFTVSDIELPTTCLEQADSFLIWQRRKTDVGDNYGVKRIQMSFTVPACSTSASSPLTMYHGFIIGAALLMLAVVVSLVISSRTSEKRTLRF